MRSVTQAITISAECHPGSVVQQSRPYLELSVNRLTRRDPRSQITTPGPVPIRPGVDDQFVKSGRIERGRTHVPVVHGRGERNRDPLAACGTAACARSDDAVSVAEGGRLDPDRAPDD